MKKSLYLTMTGLLLAFVLSACGGKNYEKLLDKDSPVTVTVWHYYNGIQQMQFDEMVELFNNTVGSEKGILVEAYSKNSVNELAESVIVAVNGEPGADEMPNIFGTYAETAYQVDKLGMLADMAKYFTTEEIDEYVEEYIREGSLGKEGSLKIVPTAKSTEVMMVNLTDWQKFADDCGVTLERLSTWEGLVDVAEQFYVYTDGQTPDIPDDGRAFFGRDSVANYVIVGARQLGHEFAAVSEDGTVSFSVDRETVRRLWENFYVPYVKGFFTSESRFRTDDAKIGAIIALVGSTTGAIYYPTEVTINDEYTYPIENVVLTVPNFEGCEPCIVQQGAGMSVIRSDEKTEYACAVFLKWFTEAERNINFSIKSGYLPVKEEANDFEAISVRGAEIELSGTMRNTFAAAIEEVNGYALYTSPPYDESAEVREYLGSTMESTAKSAHAAAVAEIMAGGDRESVWRKYTGEEAFDAWFAEFERGVLEIAGE